ncbi:TetR/AcrR family transcriptional regulator [Nocardia sp. NPDC052566]|uniref:TetR/AcrR family transcriptional regulator n=1 Tax=Nocardia sp. NPDC052566 TaxID=3364330 RepID=UPI0037C9F2B0
MSTTDRRTLIVDAAIDLIAAHGLRALTHRALDTALALPAGSASYYFRTKRGLVEGIVDRITKRSRAEFLAAQPPGAKAGTRSTKLPATPPPNSPASANDAEHVGAPLSGTAAGTGDIAHGIAVWLDRLLTERRNHLIARHALIIDLLGDAELHDRLARSLFSTERARELFEALGAADPATAAADFVAVVEGAVFDRFAGARVHLAPGTPASVNQLANLLAPHLR